ncbi:heme-binding protein [Halorientalis pallida]|uniref:Heme-binding protein n=1 Tax=Halorientalis pallida TaxID=2479928 RepID=A0A498KV49_9EURY|nr:heme-binding protein [Halorientalis pallida]RXK47389.1 heme-binding protein [Halorientalis pallida]
MTQRDPPPTEEGWYALHDFRTIDWDAWREAPERRRQRALEEGTEYLQSHAALEDVDDPGEFGGGHTAVFTVVGHKADLMIVHLRQTVGHVEAAERRFERTELAAFTEQPTSYLSVTEASGYTERARDYFEGEVDDDSGLAQYIQQRLHPEIPDAEHVCFYPMSKRRQPEQNWYDLPFDERAEHMARHGDIGRGYGGKVNQMIASSVGFDDYEWGITLWADDPTDIKDLLNEMRFDPSSSKFADFGPFYFGKRFEPVELDAYLAGEPVPTDGDAESAASHHGESHGDADAQHGGDDHAHGQTDADDHPPAEESADSEDGDSGSSGGRPTPGDADLDEDDELEGKLANLGLFPGQDYDEGTYGLVFYSEADASDLADDVDGLRGNFEHYDTHVLTTVRANEGRAAIASVWRTESAADTAAGFLNDLDGIVEGYRGPLGEQDADEPEAAGTDDEIRGELVEEDIYAGQPRGEDVFALVLYSEADADTLFEEVDGLRDSFDHYDSHVKTAVYDTRAEDSDRSAVVSLWETETAAEKAAGFLSDLPEVVGRAGEGEGFGTMGMFYTVKPDYRDEFTERFDAVGDLLADMEGHRETALLVNREDANDMFIASQWRAQDDAMEFFRSEEFSETVSWGQEVLADRPRHVFLA